MRERVVFRRILVVETVSFWQFSLVLPSDELLDLSLSLIIQELHLSFLLAFNFLAFKIVSIQAVCETAIKSISTSSKDKYLHVYFQESHPVSYVYKIPIDMITTTV